MLNPSKHTFPNVLVYCLPVVDKRTINKLLRKTFIEK